jgi:hypothetical protein
MLVYYSNFCLAFTRYDTFNELQLSAFRYDYNDSKICLEKDEELIITKEYFLLPVTILCPKHLPLKHYWLRQQ